MYVHTAQFLLVWAQFASDVIYRWDGYYLY